MGDVQSTSSVVFLGIEIMGDWFAMMVVTSSDEGRYVCRSCTDELPINQLRERSPSELARLRRSHREDISRKWCGSLALQAQRER